MNASKQKGTRFETLIARYLSERLDAEITRRALTGAQDRGDIEGVKAGGYRVVIECKDTKRPDLPKHMRETAKERANDSAEIGVLIQHAPGVGAAHAGSNWAVMSLDDLATLVNLANMKEKS